jgi:hypothetical protein
MKLVPAEAYDSGGAIAGSAAVADLTGNGKLDLVVTNACQSINKYGGCVGIGEIAILLGNGDGTFQPAVTYSSGAYAAVQVAVGDVNGDHIPDLVVANRCMNSDCTGDGAVSVLLGNGDGTFQQPVVYDSGSYYAWSVALGDLRNEGKLDIVVVNTYFGAIEYEGSVSVLLSNGDGTFQPAVNYGTGGKYPGSVAIGDLTGSGIPDLIVAEFSTENGGSDGGTGVLLGNGDGTYQPVVTYDSGGEYARSVAIGDLRGNGIPDVVVANERSGNTGRNPHGDAGVLLGNGDGSFKSAVICPAHGAGSPSYPSIGLGSDSVAVADVNGDGIADLLVIELCHNFKGEDCEGAGQVNVMPGNGDGTFEAPVIYSSSGYGGSGIAVADLNGDGRPDLIAVSEQVTLSDYEGTISVFLNETYYASKTKLSASANPAHVSQAVTFTATVTPTPPNGEVVTFYNGKTSLGTSTTTNGVASLTTSFAAAKTYTIKANYPGDAFRKSSSGTVKLVVIP